MNEQNENKISGEALSQLLQWLCDVRATICCEIHSHKAHFNTNILSIDTTELICNRPSVTGVISRIPNSNEINIRFVFRDALYLGQTTYLGVVDNKSEHFKLSLPQFVEKIQRRSFYRVRPTADKPVEIEKLIGISKEALEIVVEDVSEGGMGITISKRLNIHNGHRINRIAFSISKRNLIQCQAVVRFSNHNENNTTKLGLEFINLSKSDKEIIRQYVTTRQREELLNRFYV